MLRFRKGKGVNHLLFLFYADILQEFIENKKTISVFHDMETAFDNVIPGLIFNALLNVKVDMEFAKVLFNLISIKHLVC